MARMEPVVPVGENVNLSCSVRVGTAPVTFTWLRDGQELDSGPVLSLGTVGPAHAGTYQCLATNRLGTHRIFRARSLALALSVTQPRQGGQHQGTGGGYAHLPPRPPGPAWVSSPPGSGLTWACPCSVPSHGRGAQHVPPAPARAHCCHGLVPPAPVPCRWVTHTGGLGTRSVVPGGVKAPHTGWGVGNGAAPCIPHLS
ncbi:PREDICTED: V-set and immunoglobulin domain-containing protein 10-like [Haliaeetus leucocephalus]|uniref:V-set and immunoglobulin domain-containing protein 10-like n=1 Tax=Haliaeetus leucocephalus TaxID=52644 RepID=UPI00053CDFAC|nr:PREDICTED: V-set and immunoglobulin domain-containing protein 10-like [Haliaeetus leucocephalus]